MGRCKSTTVCIVSRMTDSDHNDLYITDEALCRSIGPVKKVDELCKIFSTTGSDSLSQ